MEHCPRCFEYLWDGGNCTTCPPETKLSPSRQPEEEMEITWRARLALLLVLALMIILVSGVIF